MHCNVDPALEKCFLELLDEDSALADLPERLRAISIAGRRDRDERDLNPGAAKHFYSATGLGERKPTAAGTDAKQHDNGGRSRCAPRRNRKGPWAGSGRTTLAPGAEAAVREGTDASLGPFLLSETEQVSHDLSINNAVGCGGRLFQPHGWQMEELVDDLGCHGLDNPALTLGELPEAGFRLRELRRPDLLGSGAQRGDRGNDGE